MAAERLARLESIRSGLASLRPRRPQEEDKALSARERLEAIQRRLGLPLASELYADQAAEAEQLADIRAASLYDSWELHGSTLRPEEPPESAGDPAVNLTAAASTSRHGQAAKAAGISPAPESRSRRLPTSPPLSPRSPPTPPVAPSEGEDWLWALGHTSQPSAPSRVGRHPEHRAHEERWRSWQGARSAAELAAASLQKPVGSDNSDKRDRAPEELAAEISKQSLEQLEALQQLPACAPPNKLPFCVGVATPRATPRKSSRRRKSSSRPPSAPSFVRPFSLDGDDLRLSGRGMGYGEQRVKPAAALGGLSRGGSRISLEGGSSKPGSVTERQPCNGKREGEGAAQGGQLIHRLQSLRQEAAAAPQLPTAAARSPAPEPVAYQEPEDLWQSMELKVFLRRADLVDLLGLLREQLPGLSLKTLLEMPAEQLRKIKARPLALKRLLQGIETERHRRGAFLNQSVAADDVSTATPTPERLRPAVPEAEASLDREEGEPTRNERERESASQMVARMLCEPSAPFAPASARLTASTPLAPAAPNAEMVQNVNLETAELATGVTSCVELLEQEPPCASSYSVLPDVAALMPSTLCARSSPCTVDRTLEAPVIRTFTADAFSKTVARSVPGEASSSQSSSTAEVDSASEPSQREAGSGSSVGSAPEGHPLPPEPPESVAPSVLAVEQEYRSRPQARRARIRELLKRLEVAQSPCPADRMRVDARQRQAKERHLRQASGAPGAPQPSSPALSLRRSRSFMELVAQSEPHFSSARSSPVDPSLLEDVVSRLPAKSVTSCSSREPCTICLEPPASGEVVTTLPCCHWYHTECIKEWLLHSRLCPLCKALVVPEELGM